MRIALPVPGGRVAVEGDDPRSVLRLLWRAWSFAYRTRKLSCGEREDLLRRASLGVPGARIRAYETSKRED